jgi:hypothetical protein
MTSTQAGGDSRADQAKETAQQATEQAKQTAQQATQQARGRVRDEVDRRSTDAGQQASSMADAFRQSAQHLREQGKDGVAKPVEQVADRVQSAGSWLERSSGDDILRDAEEFGRSKPMVVLAGGAVVGFALSRLRYQESTYPAASSPGYGSTGTTSGPYGSPALPPTTPEPPISRPAAPVSTSGDVGAVPPRGPGGI